MPRITSTRDLRSDILDALKRSSTPVQLLELSKMLRIKSDTADYDYLRQILTSLCEEGAVQRMSRRRYGLSRRDTSGFQGVLTIHHERGSVATGDSDIPTITVKRQHMSTAMDGDTVIVKPLALRAGKKTNGEVVAVVQRSNQPISGTIEYDGSFYYLVPDDAKHYVDFLITKENLHGAKPGDKVIATFLRWEHANASPEAIVKESLGQSGKASVEFGAILKEFRLPATFPQDVLDEAEKYRQPGNTVPKGRTDLRKEVIVTIDPDDARDFDDALSLKDAGDGNLELGVHIADVSHYVKEDTALDREALLRGNSTYLVDCVVPMLPERLSNDICSLVPNKPRFAFSVFMTFSSRGNLKDYRIEETVIQSKRRFTYGEVQTIIETGKGDHAALIAKLHKLARALNAKRMKQGGIDFETQEVKFVLDEQKRPVKAVVKTRTDATSLVEECMLAANKTVAEHLNNLKKTWKSKTLPPYVYRIHDNPDPEKLSDAIAVIRALGIAVPSGKLGPKEINDILQQSQHRPDKAVIHSLLLRSMAKAVYAEHNIGHYGLGFKEYAHFTSPIRRYPDLYVHRALKEYAKGAPSRQRWAELSEIAARVSDITTQTERSAVEAERASVKLAQTIMCREHLGEDHEGTVTGVTSFGVFVTIKDLMCEGLLHIRDLNDDYYYFDEKRYRLVGKRTRRMFAYGTDVRIRIAKANVEKREIDLALAPVDAVVTPAAQPGRESRGSKRRTRES